MNKKDLYVTAEIVQHEENGSGHWCRQSCLGCDPKSTGNKGKPDKQDCIKLKIFWAAKEITERKRNIQKGKSPANCSSDKRLIFRLYKESNQLN